LQYEAVTSGEDAVERIRDLSLEEDPEEFVEGLVHSATASTIITGNQCDAAPPGTRVYNQRFWSPFWHNHVRDCVRGGVAEEVMPLEQYYFRHDRGLFWVMEQATPVMNTWYIRLLFGWALNSRLFHL
jgi:delta24-sterol reductase